MGAISLQTAAALADQFAAKPENLAASRAARRSGLQAAAFNDHVTAKLQPVFSTELKIGTVTNQKHSGRCWEFSSLNVLRHYFGQKYQVKNFVFSQAYNFFWDKLERANAFYDKMIALANQPLDDREVRAWLDFAGEDGGLWPMAANLIAKYGLLPAYAMPENFNSNNTAALASYLAKKERKDALTLRKLAQTGQADQLAAFKQQCLSEIYQIAAIALGQPPKTFDLEYRDDKGQYNLDKGLTPQRFFKKYFADFNLDDYVLLLNAPNFDYGKRYHQDLYDNIVGGAPIVGLNLPMEELTQAALAQLKAGQAVQFSNDVMQQMDRQTGFMDPDLYELDALLGVNSQMSKADRLATREGLATHDMTLVGADEDQGQVKRWKVENSWGEEHGHKGFFVMSQSWFEQYAYTVIVNKKFLSAKAQALLNEPPVDVKPWENVGISWAK
ncbi:MAG: C1 family peptidase [Lactobacillus sp.]|jgi:aminopeptidase C|nr:C1 family peptidase [Lactobacillus sp.]